MFQFNADLNYNDRNYAYFCNHPNLYHQVLMFKQSSFMYSKGSCDICELYKVKTTLFIYRTSCIYVDVTLKMKSDTIVEF